MVIHYRIESVPMTRGRQLWLVRACDRSGEGAVVFMSRREEFARAHAARLALVLACRDDLHPMTANRTDLAKVQP